MSVDENLELDVYDREILKYIIANKDKWTTVNQIAKATGFSWVTVQDHIFRLQETGLVEAEEYGQKRHYKTKNIRKKEETKKTNKETNS